MLNYMREQKFISKNYESIPADNRTLLPLTLAEDCFRVYLKLFLKIPGPLDLLFYYGSNEPPV
jgi:hypothetical protein